MDIHQHTHFVPSFSSAQGPLPRVSLDFLPSVEVRAWDQSIAILGARLQPLPWVGHTPWGPVALGTGSGLPSPKQRRSSTQEAWGKGNCPLVQNSNRRRCFPPVSLPPGSSYPREEVRDSHGGGHLAAPLHPSVFAQRDVGASVQVRLVGIVVVGQEGLSELALFLEAGLWRKRTNGRASVMNEAQQASGSSPP